MKQEEVGLLCLCLSCLPPDAFLPSPVVLATAGGVSQAPLSANFWLGLREGRGDGERIGENRVICFLSVAASSQRLQALPGEPDPQAPVMSLPPLVPAAKGSHGFYIVILWVISLIPVASWLFCRLLTTFRY